ncbi:dynamin family protein [Nitzschia inconspicua]|uniref:Dynamin family protein n=1 Tax=Nitzschia inconspicua TaxID=303405 RepID=A0A9K3KZ29_9STRA|nr:dynamin family protein [Nitzschia inconspicua]
MFVRVPSAFSQRLGHCAWKGRSSRWTNYSRKLVRHSSSFSGLQGNEEIRTFMNKLTATTNVSQYIDLPMIAVMGDTSSGKSSLLSSLSDVELPSASELTTRCPIMLQMKRSNEKLAIVSIQWKDIPEGMQEEDIYFDAIHVAEEEWETLPDDIAKAQSHVIHVVGKEVARDIVHVQVHCPTCEDLTVVDLPGIVRSRVKGESENIVEDIKALIEDYLRNPRCVILAIVPANVDFHNSQIMADALQVDPHTKRTIPVITKPDLIDAGAEKDVEEPLLGRKTRDFLMGFHMVKGRGQADLDRKMTIEEGIRAEQSFFSNVQPWRDVKEKDIFGTPNLRRKLGNLQLGMIRETLPSIIAEINERYAKTSRKSRTVTDIHVSDQQTYASKLHQECERFRETICTSSLSDISKNAVGERVLVTLSNGKVLAGTIVRALSDGRVYVDYDGRDSTKRRELKQSELVFKMLEWTHERFLNKKKGDLWEDDEYAEGLCIANGDHRHDILKPIAAERVRRDPGWILPYIKKNRTEDLPIFMNQEVFRAIVVHFIESECYSPSKELVSSTKKLLTSVVEEVLNDTPELAHYPGLYGVLHHRLTDVIASIANRSMNQVKHLFEKECFPYTQDHYLQENLAKLKHEQIIRQLTMALGLNGEHMTSKMPKDEIKAILEAIAKQNQEKSMDEHMVEDMQHALEAYGKVAMKRFIDGIPMECWKMFSSFPQDAEATFLDFGDEDLRRYVVPRDDVRRKAQALDAEQAELQAGLAILESLY